MPPPGVPLSTWFKHFVCLGRRCAFIGLLVRFPEAGVIISPLTFLFGGDATVIPSFVSYDDDSGAEARIFLERK